MMDGMSTGDGGRRPWLDGVRGVAVLCVLVQHTTLTRTISLGPAGVYLFFALSGYLITGLLLNEHARTRRICLRGFYLRRATRLLPALLVLVVVIDVLFMLAGQPGRIILSLPPLLYATNYVAAAVGHHLPAFGQTWSLAVEEHFYLVWPPLLMWQLRRFALRRILVITLGLCVLVVTWRMIVLAVTDTPPLLLGVGSVEQSDSLLLGCAAAMAVRLGWRPGRWVLPLAVLTFLCCLFGLIAGPFGIPVNFFAISSAAIVASVDKGKVPALAQRVMSWRPLTAVGLRCYGLYLWHQPLATVIFLVSGRPGLSLWSAAALTVPVAWLSFRYVEQPFLSRRAVRVMPDAVRSPRVGQGPGVSVTAPTKARQGDDVRCSSTDRSDTSPNPEKLADERRLVGRAE